jgi:hypothetical protein
LKELKVREEKGREGKGREKWLSRCYQRYVLYTLGSKDG